MSSSLSLNSGKWQLLMLLTVAFCLLVALLSFAGSGQVSPAPSEAKMHRVQVQPMNLQSAYRVDKVVTGTVEASQLGQLSFDLSGRLISVLADEGDWVEQGQILATLDKIRLESQQRELQAAVARAKADARLAQLSAERIDELVAKQLESSQRQDEAREATKAAQSRVDELLASVQRLQVEVDKSQLRAPYAGYVTARFADPGTVVSAGQPLLQLQRGDRWHARFALPQDHAQQFEVGQTVQIRANDALINAEIDAIGRARRVDTRTRDVLMLIPDNVGVIPGDFVTMSYQKSYPQPGVWVPKSALSNSVRGLWSLFTLPAGTQDSAKISRKSVALHYADEKRAYVSGNLLDGEMIVVSGTHRLVPEQVVSVAEPSDTLVSR